MPRRRVKAVALTGFRRRAPGSGRRPRAGCRVRSPSRVASRWASHSWLARRSASDQFGAGTRTPRPGPAGRRRGANAVHKAHVGQRGDHPGHRRRADPFPDGQRARRHRAVVGQGRQRRQLRQRHRGLRARRNRSWRASRMTASDRSLASRASPSITAARLRQNVENSTTNTSRTRAWPIANSARPSSADTCARTPAALASGGTHARAAGYAGRDRRRLSWTRCLSSLAKASSRRRCPPRCSRYGRSSPSAHWPGWSPRSRRSSYRRLETLASADTGRAGHRGARHSDLPVAAHRRPPRRAGRTDRTEYQPNPDRE